MVKQSIEAKVRPLANASLERASLAGAARIYISTQSMLALTNGVNHGRLCVVDRLDPEPALRRHAVLWLLPDNKNLSPNVVMMTRAYQEATGFRIGDQVRITLAEDPLPDAYEVVVAHVTGGGGHEQQQQQHPQRESIYPPGWEFVLSHTMGECCVLSLPAAVVPGFFILPIAYTRIFLLPHLSLGKHELTTRQPRPRRASLSRHGL